MKIEMVYADAEQRRQVVNAERNALFDLFVSKTADKKVIKNLEYARHRSLEKPVKSRPYFDKYATEKKRAENKATQKTATNIRMPWSAEDEKFILTTTLLDRDAAKVIGRTKSAIVTRRANLRKLQQEVAA